MALSRRHLLVGAGTASLANTVAGAASAQYNHPEPVGLPTQQELWEEMLYMVGLGSRNTGFPGHVRFVDHLARQLGGIPGVRVFRDTYTLPRWEALRYSLSARDGNLTRNLHATSAYPYSGKTSRRGVSGPLVDLGGTTPNGIGGSEPLRIDRDIRGKIVLVQSPIHGFPYGENFRIWGAHKPDVRLPSVLKDAIWQNRAAPPLDQFKERGAAGVILSWVGVSDENAEGQYVPFGRKFADLPCLWVGEAAGAELRGIAARGGSATVVLEAEITPDTPTDTVYAILPGQSEEIVIVHTHSDGPNAVEENGPIGVVALAKHLASLPASARRRTYVFTLTTGHMAGAYVHSFRAFIEKHPDIMQKAVAALVLEHLGSREYVDRGPAYLPSGRNQATMVLTQSKTLADVVLRATNGTIEDRLVAVDPYQKRFTGESAALITYGVPTIGIMPAPSYLLKESAHGGIEKLDPRHFHAQMVSFTRMLRDIEGLSAAQLKS